MSGDLFSAGRVHEPEYDRPEQRPRGRMRAVIAGAGAVMKLLLYLATAGLAAGVVSYYLLSIQLPRETTPLREEWASLRESIERRLGPENDPGSPGAPGASGASGSLQPGDPGAQSGGQPGGKSPGATQPEPGTPGASEPETMGLWLPLRERLLRALALLSGQSHLAVAIGEAARHDFGAAAQTVGHAAELWEGTTGLGHLAVQARDCQSQLALGDMRGAARLRLLWYEVQKLLAEEIAGLETMPLR
ncbi:MAG: hypothetical protein Q8P31_14055 [Bacillota bacterium]|nr:hypothetical protein [Bacillota bacterium]